jgi:hypothetical protein
MALHLRDEFLVLVYFVAHVLSFGLQQLYSEGGGGEFFCELVLSVLVGLFDIDHLLNFGLQTLIFVLESVDSVILLLNSFSKGILIAFGLIQSLVQISDLLFF